MVGIGIIGAGRICAAHATAAAALQDTQLIAVADVDEERLEQARQRYGCKGYTDYRRMLEDPAVQAVVIGLPHWLHKDATIAALHAGKHVLVEKPMALNVEECDAMIAASDETQKLIMIAHSQHYFPVNREVKRVLDAGELGELVMATDRWYKPFHEGVRPPWFMEASQGGGMWPMNGSHMIDRLTYFTGSRVVSVKARVGNPIWGYNSTDIGMAFLQFENGVAATIAHAGFREGVNLFEMELTGTQGQIKFSGDRAGGDSYQRSHERHWHDVPVEVPELPLKAGAELRNPVFGRQMLDFAYAVESLQPPPITAQYGREVVRVLEACEESSRTGKDVRLG